MKSGPSSMFSSRRAWWGATLVVCLQTGCFFGQDRQSFQNPFAYHRHCDVNRVAQADPECQGYCPACREPRERECCPCPPPTNSLWSPEPQLAKPETIAAPMVRPHIAQPPAAEPEPEPTALPPPAILTPAMPSA